jgi:tetratricopeptide (TPR) repeat protein
MRSQGILTLAALCGTAAFVVAMLRPPAPARRVGPEWHFASSWPHDPDGLTQYLERHPDRLRAWYELAQRRRNADDATGAAEAWKKAAELAKHAVDADKEDPTLPFMLGWASEQSGDQLGAGIAYREAVERYERAVARDPQSATNWRDLGWCRDRLGESSRATDAWREAARLQGAPGLENMDGGALYNLACFRALAGDRDGASDALDLAVKADWTDWQWASHDEDLQSLHGVDRYEGDIAAMKSREESRVEREPVRSRYGEARRAPAEVDPH